MNSMLGTETLDYATGILSQRAARQGPRDVYQGLTGAVLGTDVPLFSTAMCEQ